MMDLAQGPTHGGLRRSAAYWSQEFQRLHSPILCYGFAGISVVFAVGAAFAFQYYQFRDVEMPLLTVAIALTTWYAGTGPSVLAVLMSAACFDYFFTEPLYSFAVSPRSLPYFLIFAAWAAIVASFSAVRRRIEEGLRQARDHLQREVEQRKQREDDVSKLNQELARRAVELEATNRELESFAYSVSHDLRAPLRHAVWFPALLQNHASSSLDENSRRYLKTIIGSAQRMGNLVDDLLSFSRIGRAETKNSAVDLDQLVKEVVAEIAQE
ncbi:MAG TPA: DUF4118 domain-containing protein, partial [Stellaceae bacterium]|nr:DUF4118 domain-containing protein [Stellaceae bacterium]